MGAADRYLKEGQFSRARRALARALETARNPRDRARGLLDLAEYLLLFEPNQENEAAETLELAREAWPGVARDPRFRGLSALVAAVRGEEPRWTEPRNSLEAFLLGAAAMRLGQGERGIAYFRRATRLPEHLRWHRELGLGVLLQERGEFEEALGHIERAMALSPETERDIIALEAANLLLELGRPEEARELLGRVARAQEALPADLRARWRYLAGLAELALGNPRRALAEFEEAERENREVGDEELALELTVVGGHALERLGRWEEAAGRLAEALAAAHPEDRAYLAHELGVAELEAGRLREAERHLKQALADPDYEHRGQAAADLAELYYRAGEYGATEFWAREAARLGNPAAGELYLGHLAYDRVDLEEALDRYRRVVELSRPGDNEWMVAQEAVVEILAQQGYQNPTELIKRASEALRYLTPRDEQRQVLHRYLERARRKLVDEFRVN